MSTTNVTNEDTELPFMARWIRRLSVPIILVWLAITLLVTIGVPPLEQVAQERSVSLSPKDAPSVKAATRMGELYKESTSDSVALIVLEGQQPLGEAAHNYYDSLIRQLKDDPKHVEHVQDFWGDPLTAVGAQSGDGKAAYVQLSLAGNQGQTLSNESVAAVRQIVDRTPAPPGVKAYVTGPAALVADTNNSGNKSLVRITAVTVAVIFIMLLLVYRSVVTVIVLLGMVGIELLAARGVVAFFGHHGFLGLSTFAINLLVSLAIAAGTDYGIFFIGRYHEARQAGEDLETAFYTTYRGVAHVVLASGLTIAGAVFCLSFTRMPYFRSLGAPCAIGMLVAVAIALTLVPAVLTVGGRFGLLEPKRKLQVRQWRRVGTAIVRWPAPIFAAACLVALVGLLALPGYKTSYDDRQYTPQNLPASQGYAAAERHFSQARMQPEVLIINSDHDMRNPADFLILDRLAKAVFKVRGISRVQGITRPDGTAMPHTSIPFQISLQNAGQLQSMQFQKKSQDDLLKQADSISESIASLEHTYKVSQHLAAATHETVVDTKELSGELDEIRDSLANFDDFFRPIRNYFYWEPHCYDIPACYALRSIFDSLDGIDKTTETTHTLITHLDQVDTLLPESITSLPESIKNLKVQLQGLLASHSTASGLLAQVEESSANATAMGKAFDDAKNDDSFYLPPEVFENPEFKRVETLFLSPDGKAVRFIISHRGDPATPEGISRIEPIKVAAEEALKGTPLEDAKIYLAGTASTYKDLQQGSNYDLLIAGIISLCLIFAIMLILTRSLIAAVTIVGTVALSLGASFGLSVLVWQYIFGIPLHWLVLAMSVLILLAVGSDYNLLLVSRFKEEIGAGIKTGIIRAMGGTGKVVTAAGLVFAFTMGSMVVSDLRIIGQIGTTIGLGLLFDTLIVRSFMMPSIAALLGRWFWWPQRVRPAPASALLRPIGPRPLVRALLLPQDDRESGEDS